MVGEWQRGAETAWDSFAFAPELNLLYIGVGNAASWNAKVRSPEGGDNLFVSSIVAVDADSGAYAWHYQTTPGDNWDYTATQHMILAEIEFGGKLRKRPSCRHQRMVFLLRFSTAKTGETAGSR